MSPTGNRKPSRAFTLLETILAMSIIAIIISVIFSITTSSVGLSKSIVSTQSNSRHQAAFHAYLTRLFSNIPSEARITLEENDQQRPSLQIIQPNTEFPALGRQHIAKELTLSVTKNRNGLLGLSLGMSNQIEDESSALPPVHFQAELINSLNSIRWEFFDTRRNEWSPEWVPSMGRPSQLKFFYSYPGFPEEHVHYFWIPARKTPQAPVQNAPQSPPINVTPAN